jgi:hypothetical protein
MLRYHVVAQYISLTPESWSRRGKQVEAAANRFSRLPWAPVRHGQWRVAMVASQVEHMSITLCEGARRRETKALACSLALWPMPRTCGTTPLWCPRR